MARPTNDMTEAQKVGLVRNALLVAGYELGSSGDHWPIINDTILKIARDWEEDRIQKNVDAELKIHLYEQLGIMEKGMADGTPAQRAELTPILRELREIYDSYFSVLDGSAIAAIRDDEIPVYIQRAETILATLGGDHE